MHTYRPTQVLTVLALVLLPTLASGAGPVGIAHFDFDDGFGQADPEGWRPLHEYEDEEAYFHVDDLSGAGQVVAPLAGSQSMWCGLAVEDPRTCSWGAPPGYGALWNQNLSSVEFAVEGDVTLEFLMEILVEPAYDFVYVQYEDNGGDWQNLDSYSCGTPGCESANQSYTVPAASHDGSIRFRFYLTSDGAGDAATFPIGVNNPIGFVLDDLTVIDATGAVDYQDFEAEALGAQVTNDGNWFAEPNTDAYDGGVLVSGSGVLQESPVANETNFWAFFDGSTRDYGCAGFPGQLAVDETLSLIRSPSIDITIDADGHAILGDPDSLVVEFDVYRDFESDADKYYHWRVSTYDGDCLLRRRSTDGGGKGDQKDWFRQRVAWAPEEGTTHIVIELGVRNFSIEVGECGSHAPLIDNITVSRIGGIVTAVGDSPPQRNVKLEQNRPNPFNPGTTIQFEVPGVGQPATLRIYDVSGRLVRTLLDAEPTTGVRSVHWDGRDEMRGSVASGVYYYELTAGPTRVARRMVLLK